ncbi:HD domain-containing protein [bacterium]|nr:HD domain-containing protein [bacterium]
MPRKSAKPTPKQHPGKAPLGSAAPIGSGSPRPDRLISAREGEAPAEPRSNPAATSTPSPVAVIDIGASGIRLRIAELQPDGTSRTLESLQRAVQLGKDVFTTGRIQRGTVDECVRILQDLRAVMTEYGITRDSQVRAVATSAFREADNRYAALDRLYMATGLDVEVIEGAEENRLMYLAVRDALERARRRPPANAIVVDVGGGSTELLLIQQGLATFAGSYRLGSLRMRETLVTQQTPSDRVRTVLVQHIRRTIDQVYRSTPIDRVPSLIAVSGDAQFAASLLADDWADTPLSRLAVPALSALANRLAPVPVDQLVKKYRLPYQEAETIGPALLAYALLAEVFRVREVLVPKCSLRDGLLKEMAAGGTWTAEFASQAVESALSLGRKCRVDEAHARHVAHLAGQLFAALRPEHRLDARFELLLQVAALLHEVGNFISDRSHHKHSLYIILNSDLFGLTRRDITLIALVARYHRRATPRPYHDQFQSLDRDSRIAVAKMAALLRVADALERNHHQRIQTISFSREKGQFVITVHDAADLTLERLALQEKGNMFEEIYGLKPVVRPAHPVGELRTDG